MTNDRYIVVKNCGFTFESPLAEFNTEAEARIYLNTFSPRQRDRMNLDIICRYAILEAAR